MAGAVTTRRGRRTQRRTHKTIRERGIIDTEITNVYQRRATLSRKIADSQTLEVFATAMGKEMQKERRIIINEWSETDPTLSRAEDNSQLSRWLETHTNAAMHTCIEVMETTPYTNGAGVTTAGRKVSAMT